eukprot:CAMPEP_0204342510 /NCGR_PEP_ID=MMETSP0469-20131031/24194_1 /ASSEMBLY_ACC=CAM_ASM_000384 /TAXON_ID=2969 /ORGANISM="Oxyrrhis marina" /LENGTH=47 /DNA_ID= /DNA_START= /DNA_END= /DNA_ORIENTATION=
MKPLPHPGRRPQSRFVDASTLRTTPNTKQFNRGVRTAAKPEETARTP